MNRNRDQNNQNTVQVEFRLCTHVKICVRDKSLTARFVTDAEADTHTEWIYGCLSIFYHCFDFHRHWHVHGSQFTDLWMASFIDQSRLKLSSEKEFVDRWTEGRIGWLLCPLSKQGPNDDLQAYLILSYRHMETVTANGIIHVNRAQRYYHHYQISYHTVSPISPLGSEIMTKLKRAKT